MRSSRWSGLGLIVGALGATLVLFHRAVLSSQIFIARDIQFVYYPLRKYWAERVAQGGFPDWYPFDALGQPFAGMVISGAFHPSNLLYLALPLGLALKVNILACYPVAFGGVYLFARRWGAERGAAALAGILFAFCGYMICITNNLLYLMSASTMPWALWAADRFFCAPSLLRAASASSLLALVLFAGDSQAFAVSSGLVLLVAVSRLAGGRAVPLALGAVGLLALTVLVAAVQFVPALGVLPEIPAGQRDLDQVLLWSTHPLRLLELGLGPLFAEGRGSPLSATICRNLLGTGQPRLWVESLHLGMPALLLAAGALAVHRRSWRAWLLVAVTGIMATLMLGRWGGLYEVLFHLVPLWRPFRYPEKLFPYVGLLLALGAAAGFHRVVVDPRFRRKVAAGLALLGLACLSLIVVEKWLHPFTRLMRFAWAGEGAIPELGLSQIEAACIDGCLRAGVACLAAALVLARVQRVALLQALVPAIAVLDLFSANEALYVLARPEVLETPSGFVQTILSEEKARRPGGYRVYAGVNEYTVVALPGVTEDESFAIALATALDPVTPSMWGLEGANNYLPAASRRVSDLARDTRAWFDRYLGLFSTRYVVVASRFYGEIGGNAQAVVAESRALGLVLLRNPTALPRAYLARPRCVGSPDEALRVLSSRELRTGREALVECSAPLPVAPPMVADLGTAEIVSYEPERVEVRVQAAADALLVLNDAYYRGWQVSVDGAPAPLLRANHVVRGVPLGPGEHRVVFTYRTPGLAAAGGVSLLTIALSFGLGLVLARRSARPRRPSGPTAG